MRVASIADHSTSSIRLRACATVRAMISITSSSVFFIWCARWIGEVDTKVWMRPRWAWRTASPARSISAVMARARPGDGGALDLLGDGDDSFEIAVGGDGETGLDDVDAHVVERFGNLQLFFQRHGGAGRLLAVAQGGVENEDAVFVGVGGGGHGSVPISRPRVKALQAGHLLFGLWHYPLTTRS